MDTHLNNQFCILEVLEVIHDCDAVTSLLRSLGGELALRDILRQDLVHKREPGLDLGGRPVVQ